MKLVSLFAVMIISAAALAQNRPFFGRVLDHTNRGIPFAVVEVKGRNEGVYCNEQGIFSFTGNTDSVKTLIVSCLGYERKEIPTEILPLDSIMVTLQINAANLKEVSFTGDKGNFKEGILGKSQKKLHYTGDWYRYYGSETAILLKNRKGRDGILKSIYVYITNEGDYTTKFRVHIYAWDSTTVLPSRELTDSNIIASAKAGNTWVKIDLSNLRIPVHEGIFASIEWIAGFGNNEKKLQSSLNPEVTGYNGQVLGITSDYGRESIAYSRKPFSKEWEYFDPPAAQRKSGRFLNPMIYCTFSYED
jgi:hypothetical protein